VGNVLERWSGASPRQFLPKMAVFSVIGNILPISSESYKVLKQKLLFFGLFFGGKGCFR